MHSYAVHAIAPKIYIWVALINTFVLVLMQCWNDSKINAAQEISRGTLQLKPLEQQGDARWVQRVSLTPAPRVKGYFAGGEITLELQYAQKV